MGEFVARPMLAEALAALATECTGVSASRCPVHGDCLCRWSDASGRDYGSHSGCPLHGNDSHHSEECEGVEDAQERLIARGLLPEVWCDVARRGWWCETCGGTGNGKLRHYGTAPCESCCPDLARPWERTGWTHAPRTIPDLVAVASLGWPVIHRAEELARASCAALREYGCPQPERVVWRVGHPQPAKEVLVVLCPWEKNNETSTWVGVDGVLHDTRWYCGAPKSKLTIGPASSLWDSGLALDAITADAVRIVVPPVGGGRG